MRNVDKCPNILFKTFTTWLLKYVWPFFSIIHERVDVLQYPAAIASRFWKVLKQRETLVQSWLIDVKLTSLKYVFLSNIGIFYQ